MWLLLLLLLLRQKVSVAEAEYLADVDAVDDVNVGDVFGREVHVVHTETDGTSGRGKSMSLCYYCTKKN